MTETRKPISGKSAKETVKTIACGNAGFSGATVVTNARAFYQYTRGCGCIGHPAFPTPSLGGRFILCTTRALCAAGMRNCVLGERGCLKHEIHNDALRARTRHTGRPGEGRDP
jgi:hypothetical protein